MPEQKARKPAALYESGDVTITEADVDEAIADARELLGDDWADMLEAAQADEGKARGH